MGAVPTIANLLADLKRRHRSADQRPGRARPTGKPAGTSLLPGWSRGHVLTHLARNAEGGTRLLTWGADRRSPATSTRAWPPAPRPSRQAAGRPAAELAEDVRRTAAALHEAAAAMPPGAWPHRVTWTTGQQTPSTSPRPGWPKCSFTTWT